MSNNNIATNVNASGKAVADFDTARFQATIRGEGTTGMLAKENAAGPSKILRSFYDVLEKEGLVEKLKTSLSVQPKYEHDSKKGSKLVGYIASFTLSFHTTGLEKVSEIHDKLTSLERVEAASPTFDVKNKEDLSRSALKKAFQKSEKRFKDECEIFGLDRNLFQINSWNARYSEDNDNVGIGRSYALSASPAPSQQEPDFEINPGKAEITCSLAVSYAWKK